MTTHHHEETTTMRVPPSPDAPTPTDRTPEPVRGVPTIVGMVDDLGRPATIYTPPEVLRRDPARWPTPEEFVSEWEQHAPERRLSLAEHILSNAQRVERLDEAIDRARMERAEAEDAETAATARADAAEDALARVTREAEELRAKVAAVEAVEDSWSGRTLPSSAWPHVHHWLRDLRAALATTGEGK